MSSVRQLEPIFNPRSVAVVGASANPEKIGYMCVGNLLEAGYAGKVYPVNPGLAQLFGLKAYSSLSAIPGEVNLAMVVIPADAALSAVEECIAKKVKGVILISGGFKEVGTRIGARLQSQIKDVADKGGLKLIGPNTLGFVNPKISLNASFQYTLSLCKPGNVALAAQSGGATIYAAHALTNANVGISTAVGLGNRCNLDFDEVVSYFGQDRDTKVIALYIEGLDEPRKFLDAARKVARRKPVVVYKAGRAEATQKSAFAHTGAIAGNYDYYRAAFKQAGLIAVDSIGEMVDKAKALSFQPLAKGNRVAVFSVQAGPAVIMADKCADLGLQLAEFSPTTQRKLKKLSSALNSVENPVDVAWTSDDFNACRQMLLTALADEGVDAVIAAAVFYNSNMELMRAVADVARDAQKPIVVCLDSPKGAAYAEIEALESAGVPVFPLPERAVSAMAGLLK
ncbi:MAG: CoA-binding protein [Dehalococcoidia bacterium]|jgi:acyl-CoA synthetase (NDP forming)